MADARRTPELRDRADRGLPARSGHVSALDGVRAVAASSVLVFHVALQSGMSLQPGAFGALLSRGDVAVPIFFALSGLLLYRPWAAATLRDGAAPGVRRYLLRRALRILPVYWLVVGCAMVLWSRHHLADAWTWLKLLLLAQNYAPAPWWQGAGPKGTEQMWTLSVETAFYLTLPLMALLLRAYAARGDADVPTRARRLLAGLAGFGTISYAWTVLEFFPGYRPLLHGWLPRAWTYFVPGMALAVVAEWARHDDRVRRRCSRIAQAWWVCWLAAGVAYAVAATPLTGGRYYAYDSVGTGLAEQLIYTIIATCFIAPVALVPARPITLRRLLGNPTISYLGRISYGIFLWQFIALYLWYEATGQEKWTGTLPYNLAGVTVLTLVAAVITHHYVEEPVRRWARRLRHPVLRRNMVSHVRISSCLPTVRD